MPKIKNQTSQQLQHCVPRLRQTIYFQPDCLARSLSVYIYKRHSVEKRFALITVYF
uniref:Uncharacterized protein n=1 Tax=Octopus bimaculoides TaxID=37653 RepID=A0A0L8FWC1_OCTBM